MNDNETDTPVGTEISVGPRVVSPLPDPVGGVSNNATTVSVTFEGSPDDVAALCKMIAETDHINTKDNSGPHFTVTYGGDADALRKAAQG